MSISPSPVLRSGSCPLGRCFVRFVPAEADTNRLQTLAQEFGHLHGLEEDLYPVVPAVELDSVVIPRWRGSLIPVIEDVCYAFGAQTVTLGEPAVQDGRLSWTVRTPGVVGEFAHRLGRLFTGQALFPPLRLSWAKISGQRAAGPDLLALMVQFGGTRRLEVRLQFLEIRSSDPVEKEIEPVWQFDLRNPRQRLR